MVKPGARSKKMPLVAAISIAVLSIIVCGLGIAAMWSGYAPERPTRFGVASALEGPAALRYGSTIFLLGLLPLLAFARSPRAVAWLGAALAVALLANLFFGARIWA